MQIHHISVLASNFASNHAFYTHTLGLRLVKDTVNQENPAIEHLFYGDYLGSPGTVITFFIVPYLGHRTDGNHSISDLILQIPRHALARTGSGRQCVLIRSIHRGAHRCHGSGAVSGSQLYWA